MSDQSERVLDALEASTRTTTEVIGHITGLKREVRTLQKDLTRQMRELEEEMGTTNSHLDNLVRAAETTNELLREDTKDRKQVQAERAKIDAEDREWRRKVEERHLKQAETREQHQMTMARDKRALAVRGAQAFWSIFKQPLGYLVAGVIAWLLWRYFGTPAS
jgi:peptidoglycan hydrolase CwlO-like protein